MKKVSIIVPVHNTEKHIEQCINSILNQTYKNFELILIDDNSTDSSSVMLKQYNDMDDRIILKHVCAGSAGKARNYGLKEADGFYLAFIDSDDWIEPTYLEDLISEIESKNCDCAMCGVTLHYKDGTTRKHAMQGNSDIISGTEMRNGTLISILPKERHNPPTFYLWDKVYKRSLWENIFFEPDLRNAEDRVALYTVFTDDVRTAITEKTLYNYRVGIGIASKTRELDGHDDYKAGYKMLKIANENGYEPSPVYETIVCHTLGKARKLIMKKEYGQYHELVCEFKKLYPNCKSVIGDAQVKYKVLAKSLYYFPKSMYFCYALLEEIKTKFERKK